MPSASVMADPEIYRPVFLRPAEEAVYYKTAGSSIMKHAYFTDVASQIKEIENDLEKENFHEVEGPMGKAKYRGVVWPMEPIEFELDNGEMTTVYLPSFFAGEETIN